ncbi:galacturonosyltransferase 4 isoform X1 [Tripterygium wilfordii]|uniref:Hexosyltransferase n=1 Tax=Tripterygium wilfordii TaxID=458696 RepID=A0A7J7D8W8_TRIWF|nr:probable galacturonosyltransferase 4 [Tripterygium wilfordii]KAF5742815.1 galacturonosyltransferase 4 isoform X1 [Tripterygium wilfordii]
MKLRKLVVGMMFVTVIAPIALFTVRFNSSSPTNELNEEVSAFSFPGGDPTHLNVLPQESSVTLKEPVGIVYSDNNTPSAAGHNSDLDSDLLLSPPKEHKSSRFLHTTDDEDQSHTVNPIREVTDATELSTIINNPGNEEKRASEIIDTKHEQQSGGHVDEKESIKAETEKQTHQTAVSDARVRHLRDQLIRAKVYLSLPATKSNPQFIRDLRGRIKEVQRALGDATKDSDLPKNANEKLKAMEQLLDKGKQLQDECAAVVKKLRAMLHASEEQLRVHRKQTLFLTQLTAKTLPKGLHCLPLRLTSEYYNLNSSQRGFPNQEKLEDPQLFHYALFSDNVLAAAVVVKSTISNAKHPSNHVFHIVTDRLNYAAMRMWFLVNPPGKATIQVQNIEEFTWLNSSYSPVLKQLGSPSIIDYYFRAHRANSDPNLKYRNPKYLSILNHLRFYLPEIYPKLNKILFLDDDIVVQKDLSGLWSIDMKGNVNGAVETCGENFHRFDRYLNFSNPLISKNFDPRACGWAYGMNIFDLEEWKRQNITDVYHTWQKLNHDRQLWKLGTLPPGLITFWKRTYPINRYWHVLGLGYNPSVSQREIERAAVVHYNGNLKPWLEIGLPKYRSYWTKYVDYDKAFIRECNINP